jgi:hypothetical protein
MGKKGGKREFDNDDEVAAANDHSTGFVSHKQ